MKSSTDDKQGLLGGLLRIVSKMRRFARLILGRSKRKMTVPIPISPGEIRRIVRKTMKTSSD